MSAIGTPIGSMRHEAGHGDEQQWPAKQPGMTGSGAMLPASAPTITTLPRAALNVVAWPNAAVTEHRADAKSRHTKAVHPPCGYRRNGTILLF